MSTLISRAGKILILLMMGSRLLFPYARTPSSQLITFFIEQGDTPHEEVSLSPNRILKKTEPFSLNKFIVKGHINRRIVEGVMVLYQGYITFSDVNGQVVLPRKHTENEIILIVTPSIEPRFLDPGLVHDFIIPSDQEYNSYKFSRITNENDELVWKITKTELPETRIVPPSAVVILAKPHNIILEEEEVPALKSPSLVLPAIKTVESYQPGLYATKMLSINRLFSPVMRLFKYNPDRYAFMLIP